MSFTLKIEFQGLIGYVPTNGGKSLLALLVEARKGRQTSDGHHLPSHVPVVQFERRNVLNLEEIALHEPEDNQKFLYSGTAEIESEESLKGLWFLDNQDLEVRYEGEDRPDRKVLIWDEDTAGDPRLATGGRRRETFFSVLPHLENVSSSASRIDPDCLLPKPKEGLLSGRFTIRDGIVQALNPPRVGEDPIRAQFRPLGSPVIDTVHMQDSIGKGVVLEMEIPGDSVTLFATKFGQTAAQPVLKLGPVPGETTPVAIQVWNLPLYDIFGLPSFGHSSATEDPHFELFYELCLRRPPLHNRPIPYFVGEQQNGNGHHDHGEGPVNLTTPWCPPAIFQG